MGFGMVAKEGHNYKIRERHKTKIISKVVSINTEMITANRAQPRKTFSEREISELADSIRENGLLQPLTVRRIECVDTGAKAKEKRASYELVSGERRLRALKYAGVEQAPCIIIDATDKQSAIFALLENIQREDLNYFEEANALKGLIVEWGISQSELGEKLGKSQPTIANKLRLLKYDEMMQQVMLGHNINERQARALLKINEEKMLLEAVDYISEHKLSAVQTERYVDSLIKEKVELPKRRYTPIVKDVRLFINTINNAVKLMNDSGIQASATKIDSDEYIEYVVRIPMGKSNTVSRREP